ncbi:MAG: hypothetical protein K2I98_07455, partial [Prevotella sp.]|nr:hypothetical protein [Prevotella sp.]
MSRKITMRGANALYTEQRTKGITDDGREIVMEGANVHYEELTAAEAPHFPLSNNEEEGKR